jgi:hypothetical protein
LAVVGCLLGGYHACQGVLGGRKPTGCENPSAAEPRTGSPRPPRNLITVDFPSTARLGLVTRLSFYNRGEWLLERSADTFWGGLA